ncbi:hypothetical protein KSS87_023115 [Heliosperma pusillum]|nr:hypothetical protein KSS87_023115 [Heliosperma pusillum]
MARKTTAKKTPPKKQTKTTHANVVEDELVEDDAIEDVASRNEKKNKVVLGKRKGIVIEESENEALEPRQIVELKKGNGKRAMTKEKEGKLIQPKAIKFDKSKCELGEPSKRQKGQLLMVRLKNPVNEEPDEESDEVKRRIIKEKEVEGPGNPTALYELIQLLTPAQKKDVEDIGFGGLLELKTDAFYHLMADWLMECYDDVSQMFMFSEKTNFVITKHDVYDVFMLPCVRRWRQGEGGEACVRQEWGALGIGEWQTKFYPISRDRPKVLYRLSVEGSHDLDAAAPRTITLPLAAGLLTDEELRFKYPDIRVRKWMTTKRNLELVSKLHNDMTKDLEAFVSVNVVLDEVVQAEEVENGEQPPEVSSQFSWTQALMDPSFLDDFHALGKKVDELLKINLVEPPSFDLGLDDVHIQEEEARGDAVEDPIHANENTVVERFRRRYSRVTKKQGRKA